MDRETEDERRLMRRSRWPGILLCTFGVVLLLGMILPFSVVRSWLDASAYDGSAEPYTQSLHGRLQVASVVIGTLLVGNALIWLLAPNAWLQSPGRWMHRFRQDAVTGWTNITSALRTEWFWLLFITIVALAIRLPWVEQPVRFDEAVSWLDYASQPLVVTVAKYDQPNNHVFHNLCMAVAVRCFGSSLWAIRLTALVAGVLTCVLAGWLTFSLTRPNSADSRLARFAGMLAGLCVAVSSPLIEYSTLGRGYTLVGCLTLICWIAAREAVLSRNLFYFGISVVACALGFWTMPVMLYPLQMLFFLMIWDPEIRGLKHEMESRASTTSGASLPPMDRRKLCLWLLGGGGAAVIIAGFLYLPALLVGGVSALAGNSYVTPMSMSDWLGMWKEVLFRGMTLTWREIPFPVRFCWIFGIATVATRADRWLYRLWLFLALLVPVFLMPLLQRVHPPSRVWLYVVPVLAVFAAWGWCGKLQSMRSRRSVALLIATLVGVMVIWPATSILVNDPIARSTESGPAAAAGEAAEFLKAELQPGEPVITVCPASAPLRYYADRLGIDWAHFDRPTNENTRDDMAIVVVSNEGDFDQTVESVLAELNLEDEFQDWPRREIWSRPGLTLYRLELP